MGKRTNYHPFLLGKSSFVLYIVSEWIHFHILKVGIILRFYPF